LFRWWFIIWNRFKFGLILFKLPYVLDLEVLFAGRTKAVCQGLPRPQKSIAASWCPCTRASTSDSISLRLRCLYWIADRCTREHPLEISLWRSDSFYTDR
jgi:hypothetical protein